MRPHFRGLPPTQTTRFVRTAETVAPGTIRPTRFSRGRSRSRHDSPGLRSPEAAPARSACGGSGTASPLKPLTNRLPARDRDPPGGVEPTGCRAHGMRSESCTARSRNITPQRLMSCSATASGDRASIHVSHCRAGTTDHRPGGRGLPRALVAATARRRPATLRTPLSASPAWRRSRRGHDESAPRRPRTRSDDRRGGGGWASARSGGEAAPTCPAGPRGSPPVRASTVGSGRLGAGTGGVERPRRARTRNTTAIGVACGRRDRRWERRPAARRA